MLRFYGLILLLHIYVGARLLPNIAFAPVGAAALVIWLLASMVLMPFVFGSRRAVNRRAADRMAWAGGLAMGAFSSLLVLTVARDVALLAVAILNAARPGIVLTQTFAAYSAAAVPVAALLLTMLGVFNARRRAQVRTVDVPIAGLASGLHGFTIVQISDIHVGPTIKRRYLDAIVDAVNALDADMIAVTGDLVDGSVAQLAEHTAPLSRLRSRHGAYFVTGNHEYYSGVRAWTDEIRRLGLRVLLNQHVVLQHEGESMVVGGVTDFGAHHFDPAQRSDPSAAISGAPAGAAFRLLLAHQPRSALAAMPAGFDLQLSGHTHGGQFVPWNFFVRMQQPFTAGLHKLGTLWVYISRGTGYWGPPIRLGAPSEITRLRLMSA